MINFTTKNTITKTKPIRAENHPQKKRKKKKKKEKKRKKENERWEEKKKKKIQVELSELVWWIKMWITGERIGNYHCRTHILMDPHNKNFVAKNNLI